MIGIFRLQAAHLGHLLAVHRMDHAARAEEQQGFEEGVSHEVEQAGGAAADAERGHHVAELADGGIGQRPS